MNDFTEFELMKLGCEMFVKIFHNFGGWYFVLANLIFFCYCFSSNPQTHHKISKKSLKNL